EIENATPRDSKLNQVHEGTFGGPILRHQLWFFGAGRLQRSDDQETFQQTGIPYVIHDNDKRGEIKLTATVAKNHTISGQLVKTSFTSNAPAFSFTIDPAALPAADYPGSQFVTTYRGTFHRSFVEAQYSQKTSAFRNAGGTSPLVVDSPMFDLTTGYQYNAP